MNEKPTYEELEQKIKRLEKEASQIKQTGDTPEVALSNMEQDELTSLFNLAIDMLCIADINGCFRSINKAWETNLGYSREDLLSKPYIDFVHPDDVESTLAEGQKLLQGQRSICFENRYRCKDGSYKWLAWTSSPHPETGITYAVARDITEKKRAETELCESEDRWRSFTENSPDHIMLLDKDYTIRFINHTVPDLTKEQVIGKSVFDFLPSDQHQEAIECFERVIQCSKPDRYETRYLTVNGETQYFDVRVSPLIVKSGSITGLLSTSNNITERKQAEEELKKHREHLEELVAGQTKDLQKVNERLQAEVTEHKQAEVELRKSKERFRVILDQTFQFIGLMTPDGILIEVNKTALNFSGIDEADVIGKPFWETPWWTHSKELQNKLQEAVKQASAGEFIRFEATHQDSGGKLHIVDFSVNPVKDEKGVVSLLIPEGRDITELKHIDEALRLERDKLKNLSDGLSQTSIGIDIVTKKYEVLYQNQVLMDRFGDLNGKRCYEEYLGLKEPCIECPMEKAIENNSIERIELTAPDGKCYELIAAPFQNPDGTIDKAIEVVMDITERKQVAEALEKSEERYRRLAENAKDMIYRMSLPDGIYEYVSPASNDIFGYSPEEWYNSSKLIQKIIHPDWHAYFKEQWENLIADNMPPIYEFQIIHKSGETKWIHQRNVMVHDDNGQAIAIEGIVTDITERKQAEEELQKLASVVRYSSELVNLATLDGKMIFLNNAGSKMLGIEPEEVGQANIMDVIPDHLVDLVQKDLLPSLMNNRTWEGDLQYRNIKTGKLTDVHAMTFSIQDSATGKPLYFANVSLDITDRKHTEVALQESQKRLTNFMDSSTDSFYLLDSDLNFVEVNRMGLMI
ncbi:MAG: PAS domain S-box protein, partial [bacterium]|nr:PAS domain S-box protein [bacterium]